LFVEIASSPTVRLSRLGGFSAELCYATGVTYPKPALFSVRDIPGSAASRLLSLHILVCPHSVSKYWIGVDNAALPYISTKSFNYHLIPKLSIGLTILFIAVLVTWVYISVVFESL
jgi:hypothetical protein